MIPFWFDSFSAVLQWLPAALAALALFALQVSGQGL
jgi:hypothetical protein